MTEPKPTQRQPGQELTQEDYMENARKWLLGYGEAIKDLAEANEALVEGAGDQEYTFWGYLELRMWVFYTEIEVEIHVNDGSNLYFKGKAWGAGTGVGLVYGGGTFGYIQPSELIGDCDFELHGAVNGVQVNWLRGSKFLGTFMGAGVALNLGVYGGSGRFTYDTDGS